MNAQDVARMVLDRLGDLASNYDIGENAMDYLESIRVELRPIAWPDMSWNDDEIDDDEAASYTTIIKAIESGELRLPQDDEEDED